MSNALHDLIRERRQGMTIDIEARLPDGSWEPVGGHGCYSDEEARAYASMFTTEKHPLRTRPIAEVHPWWNGPAQGPQT